MLHACCCVYLLPTLTLTPLPPQLTSSWPVLGDSTLWAGFVPSSVFQFRLVNPTLTLSLMLSSLSLSLTLTQTPLTTADREVSVHGWRLVVAPCGLVMCACRTRAAVVCVVLDSKMVAFHSEPLCFSGSSFADRFSSSAYAGHCELRSHVCLGEGTSLFQKQKNKSRGT